jgi:hypothetical protein
MRFTLLAITFAVTLLSLFHFEYPRVSIGEVVTITALVSVGVALVIELLLRRG